MPLRFIAEISGNHNGSLDQALKLVKIASESGATHLKLQTYSPQTITLDVDREEYKVGNSHPLWPGRSLYELYDKAQTPRAWHREIFDLASTLGMVPFSTPFDETAVDFLEELDVGLYKIASLEIVDLPLISYVAATKKPLILSTGAASIEEVDDAVEAAITSGCTDLTLLVCTSDYPAAPRDAHLNRIKLLQNRFSCEVGLSDHTIGSHVAIAAIALGARTIEKHICIDRNDGGVDSGFSATPFEMAELVRLGGEVMSSLGSADAWNIESETQSRLHRPSLIATREILLGERFTHDNIATLRPNIGMSPKHLAAFLDGVASRQISRGDGLNASDMELRS